MYNKTMKNKTLWIIGGIIVVVALHVGVTYNTLVTLNNGIDGSWAQVETQYQRRLDLIPNLVETVKGIFKQEKEVFGALAEARTKYGGAVTINEKVKAATQVEGALSRLLAVIENYPTLRSSDNVSILMTQLEGTENRISVERGRFNDAVLQLNTKVQRVPSNIVARLFGFRARAYFESVRGAEVAPKVGF